jgi:hypothetical protein
MLLGIYNCAQSSIVELFYVVGFYMPFTHNMHFSCDYWVFEVEGYSPVYLPHPHTFVCVRAHACLCACSCIRWV